MSRRTTAPSRPHPRHQRRRGFSLVEVLVSLVIISTLLTATMAALDASFKAYKVTTESASTHVVARMVASRVASMVRTGTEFGPFPADVLDVTQNPMVSTSIEFKVADDPATNSATIVTLERRDPDNNGQPPFELWYEELQISNGVPQPVRERPLLTGLQELQFTLEYDVGPRLRQATMDMTVLPNDFQDGAFHVQSVDTPVVRLVQSMRPQKLSTRR